MSYWMRGRRGMGMVEIEDPLVGYAMLLQGKGIGGEFSQRALIEATNIYNRRNVGSTHASDLAAFNSGGLPALASALANMGTVSSTHVDTWDDAQTGGTGTTVNLQTMQAQAAANPPATVTQPTAVQQMVQQPAQGAPALSTTLPNPATVPSSFNFSAIPMWAWLGAGAVALYSFSGGKRR